jgi:hypothetical protein
MVLSSEEPSDRRYYYNNRLKLNDNYVQASVIVSLHFEPQRLHDYVYNIGAGVAKAV